MVQSSWRKFVFAGVLGGISGILALTPLGLIPVPNLSTYATTMHIPAIIGGIIGGPLVGALVGCVLAFFTMHLFLGNLVACFLPRIFIGVVAYFLWRVLGKGNLGILFGSLGGTLTNTVGVLGLMVFMKYFTWEQVLPIFLVNGILELLISGVVVLPIVKIVLRVFTIDSYPRG
ncbi:MAG: ECF transporter S component [Atribacterota bacterium]